MDGLFFLLVTLYFFTALKTYEWSALLLLGFKMEVPKFFPEYREIISGVPIGLFFIACLAFYGISDRLVIVGGVTLVVSWLLSRFLGEMSAFARYRVGVTEMLSFEKKKKGKQMLQRELGKTDKQLRKEIRTMDELFKNPNKLF